MAGTWRFRPPPPPFDQIGFGSPPPPFPAAPVPPPQFSMPPEPFGPGLRPGFRPPQRFLEGEPEVFRKRMRVDGSVMGDFAPSSINRYDPVPCRVWSEDERRLSLIRNHGRQVNGMLDGERCSNGEYQLARYVQEGIQQTQYRGTGMDHGFHHHDRNRLSLPLPPGPGHGHQNNPELANAYEGLGHFPPPQEPKGFRGENFDTGGDGFFNSQFGEYPYGRNGQVESLSQLPLSSRHGNFVDGSESYAFRVPDGRSYDPQQRDFFPPSDIPSRGPEEMYLAHNTKQLHPVGNSSYILPKQPQYLETDGFQRFGGLNHDKGSAHLESAVRQQVEQKREFERQHGDVMRTSVEVNPPLPEDIYRAFEPKNYSAVGQYGMNSIGKQGGYPPLPDRIDNQNLVAPVQSKLHTSQIYPPLPTQPPPVVPPEPSPVHSQEASSLPLSTSAGSMLSAVPRISANTSFLSNPHLLSESQPSSRANFYSDPPSHSSAGIATERMSFGYQTPPKQYPEEGGQLFPLKHVIKDKATIVDASHLFRMPHRASRPDHFVIILRGLPGSGKSYLAKALRDVEVENGGSAPRIHAIDDYFMLEVEKKVEDNEGSKFSGSVRGKKQITKKVVEYCYEPEMEEVYRSSMLKAFKKTIDEGIFTFVIVDDRNLRVADFAQFWAIAKRSGYEVYLLEATYKDPTGCAARNIHGFTVDDIHKMADQWEESPALYLQLDIQSLFHGDNLDVHSIQEVDMDMDDSGCDKEEILQSQEKEIPSIAELRSYDYASNGLGKVRERWDSEEEEGEDVTAVKELQESKWLKDVDEEIENPDNAKAKLSALSGLMQAYGKGVKSVHWGDEVEKSGFSISAIKKQKIKSLIIGPGSGYNVVSNPLVEEDALVVTEASNTKELKRRFTEQLRAERESFKAVFDKRRQRIGGLYGAEDE